MKRHAPKRDNAQPDLAATFFAIPEKPREVFEGGEVESYRIRYQKILAILGELFGSPERGLAAPAIREAIARDFALMDGRQEKPSFTADNSPEMRPIMRDFHNITVSNNNHKAASRKVTDAELNALKTAALELYACVVQAHLPATEIINFSVEGRRQLGSLLTQIVIHADMADTSSLPIIAGKGQPKKSRAAQIADRTAEHYLFLTGKKPTVRTRAETGVAYGPFIDLLTAIFEVTETKASVESQARAACARFGRS